MTDPAFLEDALSRMNPDYIFNGIAYTAVDLAESEKERACALNRAFPALLGGMTRGSGAHLIHFSTDFVFNGKSARPIPKTTQPTRSMYTAQANWPVSRRLPLLICPTAAWSALPGFSVRDAAIS